MKQIIQELLKKGYDYNQIKDAMEDGEYLAKEHISQEDAESVHNACVEIPGIPEFDELMEHGDPVKSEMEGTATYVEYKGRQWVALSDKTVLTVEEWEK